MIMSNLKKMRQCVLLSMLLVSLPGMATFTPVTARVSVCFTPGNACMTRLLSAIQHAQQSIDVQAFSFTAYPIAKALVDAAKRGIQVRVIADNSQFVCGAYSKLRYLWRHHIPVWDDSALNIAHNKVMIIDNHLVETGSFNYTISAQRYNAENMVFIDNPALAARYEQNWKSRERQAQRVLSDGCVRAKPKRW